jgi:hypothetical protein
VDRLSDRHAALFERPNRLQPELLAEAASCHCRISSFIISPCPGEREIWGMSFRPTLRQCLSQFSHLVDCP